MKLSNYGIPLTFAALLLSALYGCSNSKLTSEKDTTVYTAADSESCTPDASWLTNPSLPTEIATDETFCDFYKFSLQSFTYFLSKDKNTSKWNFENKEKFPVYNYESPGSSCSTNLKTLSASINQAFRNDVIYDQDKNVVYYSVHFTRELCSASKTGNLPDGTIELKMAWKVLKPSDKNRYVNITTDIVATSAKGNPQELKDITLGLAGMHIIQSTKNHPEMMWGSYEHVDNNPLCKPAGSKNDYSFINKKCLAALKAGDSANTDCKFNQAEDSSSLTAKPSQICRVFADGSDPSNPLYEKDSHNKRYDESKYTQNVDAINQLNKVIAGNDYFNSQSVLKNYRIVGGLWQSDINKPSSDLDNQRGSLEMSNTLMETAIQGGNIPENNNMMNCFACHSYTPGDTAEHKLSHIFNELSKNPALKHSFVGHK